MRQRTRRDLARARAVTGTIFALLAVSGVATFAPNAAPVVAADACRSTVAGDLRIHPLVSRIFGN